MSILAAATQPSPSELPIIIGRALAFAIGMVAIAYATRLLRPKSLTLPDRLPFDRPGWLLLVVTIIGTGLWMGAQVGYLIVRSASTMKADGQPPTTQDFDPAHFTPIDYGYLSTLPALVGLITLLLGDWMLGGGTLRRSLGYDRWKLPRGVALGVLAMLLTLPFMSALNFGLEALYRLVEFDHPKEHELLEALGKSTEPAIRWMIVAGAVVGAPLFEELLFRAHLQTTLRRLGLWLATPRPEEAPGGFPVVAATDVRPVVVTSPGDFVAPPPLEPPILTSPEPLPPPPLPSGFSPPPLAYDTPVTPISPPSTPLPAWPSWVAILCTSVLFALVHPLWSAPLIFALSLCLGYAYERTGNLWVSITMHAIFNGLSTALVFMGMTDG